MTAEMEVIDDTPDTLPVIRRRNTRKWKSIAKAAERLAAERLDVCVRLGEHVRAAQTNEAQAVEEATRSELIAVALALALALSVAFNVRLVLG